MKSLGNNSSLSVRSDSNVGADGEREGGGEDTVCDMNDDVETTTVT